MANRIPLIFRRIVPAVLLISLSLPAPVQVTAQDVAAASTIAYPRMVAGNVIHGVDAHVRVVDSAVDSEGRLYITGAIRNFALNRWAEPATTVPPATLSLGAGNHDVFVARFSANGNTLDYLALVGGANDDTPTGIVVDASGRAIVVGWTESADFPEAPNGLLSGPGGGRDAFAIILNPAGGALAATARLGGTGDDAALCVALGPDGAIFLGGSTASASFPVTSGVLQAAYGGAGDGFLAKLSSNGDALHWATFFGGVTHDEITSVVVDPQGTPIVAGSTNLQATGGDGPLPGLPVTSGSFSTGYQGRADAFVFKFTADASNVVFGGYLGGSEDDTALRLLRQQDGTLIVAGNTFSAITSGPTLPHVFFPHDPPRAPGGHYSRVAGFVSGIAADGSRLLFSRLPQGLDGELKDLKLGEDDRLAAIVVDPPGETRWLDSPPTDLVTNPVARLWGPTTYALIYSPDATALLFQSRPLVGALNSIAVAAGGVLHLAANTADDNLPLGPATATALRATPQAAPLLLSAHVMTLQIGAPTPCLPQLQGLPGSAQSEGATGVLQVLADPGCPWILYTNREHIFPWSTQVPIRINGPAAGVGQGTDSPTNIPYDYPPNDGPQVLQLVLDGSMASIGLTQLTSQCRRPRFVPSSLVFPSAGGTQTVWAQLPSGCPIEALTPAVTTPWLAPSVASPGVGGFQAAVTAAVNSGIARSVDLRSADARIPVLQQSGAGGLVQFGVAAVEVGPSGGTVILPFQTQECPWTAASSVPWAVIAGASAGAACTGSLEVAVEPFSGQFLRDALIYLNGVGVRVRQFGFDTSLPAEPRAVSEAAAFNSFRLAAGGLASVFGNQLALTVAWADTIPLPTTLGGVRLKLVLQNGREVFAPLLYVSPRQINFHMPEDALGPIAATIVAPGRGSSTHTSRDVLPQSPSLFEVRNGSFGARVTAAGYAHLVLPDGTVRLTPLDECDLSGTCWPRAVDRGPSGSDLHIVLFGTGFPADAALAEYQGPLWQPGFTVTYAGRHKDYVGLQQINIRIPREIHINPGGMVMFDVAVRGERTVQLPVYFQPLVD
ncbi:MAG: hypothetical protein KIT83_20160 [Bryobacterales bacterium]|nr:hypothetical protein [Bryobacterales bacterium]